MLKFATRVTYGVIEKPLIGLSKTIFPKTRTVVKKFLNPNLAKGEQLVKRTIFRGNDITAFADIHHIDLTHEAGKKVLKAFDSKDDLLAEGVEAIRQLMQKGKKRADFWYKHH